MTPQTECSWVSFETNLEKESYSSLISQVLSLFRPGKCAVSLFASKVSQYVHTLVVVSDQKHHPPPKIVLYLVLDIVHAIKSGES